MTDTPATPAVNYVQDNQMLRAKVRGTEVDVPITEARRLIQQGLASEQSLKESNRLLNTYTSAIDGHDKVANIARSVGVDPTLMTTQPQAFLQALAARFGGQGSNGHPSQPSPDADMDPNTTALHKALSDLTQRLNLVETQASGLATVNAQETLSKRIDSALEAYPLLKSNAPTRELAKQQIVSSLMADNGKTIEEAAGYVHRLWAEARTVEANQQRDALVDAEQRNRGLIPGQAQPALSAPAGPTFTKEDRAAGNGPRQWMKNAVGKTWGSVK